jgi:peptidoglycan pentaglycine glycine transferase (the first glycine)
MSVISVSEWNRFLFEHPEVHFKQSVAWGNVKSGSGWYPPAYIISGDSGAQILFPKLPLGIKVAYIPGGPVGCNFVPLWKEIDQFCQQQHVIFLKVEPHAYEPLCDTLKNDLNGFVPSDDTLQVRRSIIVDLDGEQALWLSRMKHNTRSKIKGALCKGMVVNISDDINLFTELMEHSAEKHQFNYRGAGYNQKIYQNFIAQKNIENPTDGAIFIAEYEGVPLSAMLVVATKQRAWCLHCGSTPQKCQLSPTYPIILKIMHWAADHGCKDLDLWGVPDYDEEELEAISQTRVDGMWGAYRFKRSFGGRVVRSIGAWDRVYNPMLYGIYQSKNYIKTHYPNLYKSSINIVKKLR